MAKLLTLLVLGILVYMIVNRMRSGERPGPHTRTPDRVAPGKAEDMVRCAQCGVHLPRSESFTSHGRFYCSEEHRRLGAPTK